MNDSVVSVVVFWSFLCSPSKLTFKLTFKLTTQKTTPNHNPASLLLTTPKVINCIEVFQLSPAEVKLLLGAGADIDEIVFRVKRDGGVDTVEDRIALRAMVRKRQQRIGNNVVSRGISLLPLPLLPLISLPLPLCVSACLQTAFRLIN